LNEIIDRTKHENRAIILLLFPEIAPFNPQIRFQLFIRLLCPRSIFILPYNRFGLSIECGSKECNEIVIALPLDQRQVSRSPLPNTPFERVDNVTFAVYRPLNWLNITYQVFLSEFGAESYDNEIRVQPGYQLYAGSSRLFYEFARF
jgi:hypothetical protein